jgi:hypothetical protein
MPAFENTSRSAERPFHLRSRAVAEKMLAYLENSDLTDPDVEALAAFGSVYAATIADKRLRFEMSCYNSAQEAEQRNRNHSAFQARLSALDAPRSAE